MKNNLKKGLASKILTDFQMFKRKSKSIRRIGLISHWGFKSLHGGNLRAMFLLKEWIQRGYEVTVILADPRDVSHVETTFGCQAVSVNCPMSRWDSTSKKWFRYLIFANKVRRYINRSNLDAVFGVNLVQALAAVTQRKAISWVLYVDLWADFFEYDSPRKFPQFLFSRVLRALEYFTMFQSNHLVILSKAMLDLLPRSIQQKSHIVPDGVDTQRFFPKQSKSLILKRWNIDRGPVFSYQGGIARHEGLDLLCRAAPFVVKEIPQAKFLIVGKGEFLSYCQKLVRELCVENSFIFTGWIDHELIPQILREVDVSVVPMPNVRAARPIISFKLLEAMATGTLVVANRLPGLSEIVNDEMAVLTRADDPRIFGRGLIDAYHLKKTRKKKMIQNALNRVQHLDWRMIAVRDADHFLNKEFHGNLHTLRA